jgi:PIN domain nuclease of toxin-antitoxin system
MDVGVVGEGDALQAAQVRVATPMVLLDTNALIWLEQGHARAQRLLAPNQRLYASPASLLELQYLVEAGRIRVKSGSIDALGNDSRWALDDPPAASWFSLAMDIGWTRDPFDRLLVAHARLRGWKFATADTLVLERLSPRDRIDL